MVGDVGDPGKVNSVEGLEAGHVPRVSLVESSNKTASRAE